ncbi:MAG: 2-C-methyl-D-erythritol 2,4-cyclodiphosphate synthase [Epsilonproteobacteria bacterium]|nr:2-C-methyl-D-erythritol 2,4-cyclodiphosphate synthase [Campylobacterota bacterium]NPA88600.1 2-C-methyl-D-erythritol 2,4-cyclodiphosphate synthase [Campylobacterota bacterium]
MEIALILLAGGKGKRFNYPVRKQWLAVGSEPLWLYTARKLAGLYPFEEVVVVGERGLGSFYRSKSPFLVVEGGRERQESLERGLEATKSPFVMVSDVVRPGVTGKVVERLVKKMEEGNFGAVVPYISPADTVVYRGETIERSRVKLIQTPQLSRREWLERGLEKGRAEEILFTDERGAIEAVGGKIGYVEGERGLWKLTYFEDLRLLNLPRPTPLSFSGIGYDSHRFQRGGVCKIGGVEITEEFSFKAHSDGDLVVHAVIDALLGASGGGDIGEIFPDTDPKYKNADSMELLAQVVELIGALGFEIVNIDITYVGEKPRLKKFKPQIVTRLREVVKAPVNIKGSTNEKMGFIGREEGAVAISVANLRYKDWYEDYYRGR